MSKVKFKNIIGNGKSKVIIGTIGIISLLMLVGLLAATTTVKDIKISRNLKSNVQSNSAARAGIEHAMQVLKTLDASGTDPDSFSDELKHAAGADTALEGYTGFDDVPIVNTTNIGNGSYTVYLINDPVDGYANHTDTNNTVCIISVATNSEGLKSIVKMTISIVAEESSALPGTVAMLSSSAEFYEGT